MFFYVKPSAQLSIYGTQTAIVDGYSNKEAFDRSKAPQRSAKQEHSDAANEHRNVPLHEAHNGLMVVW